MEPASKEAVECCTAWCSSGLPCLASCCWTWSESQWVLIFSLHSVVVAVEADVVVVVVADVVVAVHAVARAPQLAVEDC